jgi:lipoprotein-anchoring transpeptidase ErfK/SrfK
MSKVGGILLTFTLLLLSAGAWTITSPNDLNEELVIPPTRERMFAYSALAKPTYTLIPTVTAMPSNTPQAVAEAVIVDTSIRAFASNSQPPVNYTGGKRIFVDISEQHMYVYDGDSLVFSFVASTGIHNGTRTGVFSVLDKIPNAYGATWDIWMPNWLGIYYAGSLENGIHALPILPNGATLWAGFLGTPISYGCVVLDTFDAQVLYEWAEVGVPVEIQR